MPAAVCPAASTSAMASATACARSRGVTTAVPACQRETSGIGSAAAIGSRSGSGSCNRVRAVASSTTWRMDASSSRLVVARAVRPSICTRTESCALRSATFWWMALLAKRVSALEPAPMVASASATPRARAAVTTRSKMAWQRAASIGIRASDLDAAETRGAGPVARAHHLLRLPLAAVGRTPQCPMLGTGDGCARIPEFRGDPAVAGILEHADALAAADLPADLAAELEVVALVVDRPAAVSFHVDPMVGAAEDFVERLPAGSQAHIGHADQRQARPAVGAHSAVRARRTYRRGGFARGHVAGEQAVADDVGGLRRHAFIVEREGAQTGTVLGARVAHHVDNLRAIAQAVQLIERQEAHAGIIGLAAEHAVQLDGVPDGFVDLQAELRTIQDEVEIALGALIGAVQRHGLLRDARGILHQVPLFHQFVALELMLAAERIRVRAFLDLAVFVGQRRVAHAAHVAGLIDQAAN